MMDFCGFSSILITGRVIQYVNYLPQNGRPVELRLIDFQIIRYASPVLDVLQYLFLATTKELRDEHFDEFLNVYYEALSGFIKRLEISLI
jgi:hypothetical protein